MKRLLSQHPAAEAALGAELDRELKVSPPAVADLPRLPYAGAVVRESLRLYPPAWIMTRGALEECEIGGYHVPSGAMLMAPQWAMHRDPRYYQDPLAFVPERWLHGLADRLPRFAYFPFGGGPRQCIGYQFAMMETVLVLATIAQRFRLRLTSTTPVVPRPAITLRPEGPVRMLVSDVPANQDNKKAGPPSA